MDTLTSIDLVRNVGVFSTLTERQLEAIVEICRPASARAGVCLLRAGDLPSELSIVLVGQVRVVDDRSEIGRAHV